MNKPEFNQRLNTYTKFDKTRFKFTGSKSYIIGEVSSGIGFVG